MVEYSLKSIQRKGDRLIQHYFFDGKNTSLIREFCRDSNGRILNNKNYKRINDSILRSFIISNEEILKNNIKISKIETKVIEWR